MANASKDAWTIDQLTKSEFFHQKLHEWQMLEVANDLEAIKGEDFTWNRERLMISPKAWDKVIHRGIKPIMVFAHPAVLMRVPRAASYYRMLSMVSQKSMMRVGLGSGSYEKGKSNPDLLAAETLAAHLNRIISNLIEADEEVDAREFELWRGMAAGSQAQGSWGNTKGDKIEVVIKGILQRRMRDRGLVTYENEDGSRMELADGRTVQLADEPDFAIYRDDLVEVAVEIKGGIDTAGVLERIGAAIKSLSRAKRENPLSKTVLIVQAVSITDTARSDLEGNKAWVNYCYYIEDLLDKDEAKSELFVVLGI